MSWDIRQGDWIEVLRTMPDESVHCVVTSPPYWGLRDYGVAGQLGIERTPEEYVAKMVEGFREVHRVLRDDGTCWINLGDSYFRDPGKGDRAEYLGLHKNIAASGCHKASQMRSIPAGMKPKDLCGIPWMVAFALRADGWYLRQDIIWSKPNPMPESVRDRCTKAHEYIFLLSKSERYYYDADAIRTPFSAETKSLSFETMDYGRRDEYASGVKGPSNYKGSLPGRKDGPGQDRRSKNERSGQRTKVDINANWDKTEASGMLSGGANKRSVWTVSTCAFPEAHFATFPPEIPETCIKAGCPEYVCSKCGVAIDKYAIIPTRAITNGNDLSVLPEVISAATIEDESESLLQQEVHGQCAQDREANSELRLVRETSDGRSQGKAEAVLQQGLCLDLHGEAPQHHQGPICHSEGLHRNLSTGAPGCIEGRLCDGASVGDGKGNWETVAIVGNRSPQERDQVGQSTRESGTNAQVHPRQASEAAPSRENNVPTLPLGNRAQPYCPRCKADLTLPEAITAGTTLDPFSGAGTTGLVATRLGRNYIGIELNPEYIEMASKRITQDAPLFNSQPQLMEG